MSQQGKVEWMQKKNPHPETCPDDCTSQIFPNQRHQDWASGHAIGFSEGTRLGIQTAKELLARAKAALDSDAILMGNQGLNASLREVLGQASEEDPVMLNIEGTDAVVEVEP